uniref:Retrotransposon, putative, centromere-specific n=2 Tax=Oryza sativa subsp. japonica TaxID=39947 RepID=Q75GE6_ORYSJ|nr:hypothetical protein [Oryza sativa Japonica Group]ABF98002.1 retrotransposon, putative, centromere-specific [Oryza sativa Japonica Group]
MTTSPRNAYESFVSNKPETWDECKTMMRKRFVMLANVTYNYIGHLFMLARSIDSKIMSNARKHEQCDLSHVFESPISLYNDDAQTNEEQSFVSPVANVLQGVQNIQQTEYNDVIEKKREKHEAPAISENSLQGKLNGAETNEGEYTQGELHISTFHAILEQPLVEPIAEMPLSQVDLIIVPCDKEELCNNTSLISMPQLVNENAISSVSLCADFKHVVHIANDVEECKLITSLNTLGYVQFDDFCELDNLEEKLFAKSDLPCPANAIFHIFGEYNDRGIYLVHRVFICSYLEKHVVANHTISSFSSFDWMKQVILNGLCEEHHIEKPRTVFREEWEDDVTMATMDTTVAHIMDQEEHFKIRPSKFWNPIRPPATVMNSNGRQMCIRAPFWVREYLMESIRSRHSNRSNLTAKFLLSHAQLMEQGATSPVMGLWACNFVWDPSPSGAHVGNKVHLHRQDQQSTERCIDR